MNDHERHMRRAIELAANVPEVPFGAIIVDRDTGTILSEGWNKTSHNPAWHCTLIGGILERECDCLFEWAMSHRDQPK